MTGNDIYERFLPLFLDTAQERLGRVAEQLPPDDADKAAVVASEMHALAGEACALGLMDMGALALSAEDLAKKYLAEPSPATVQDCSEASKAIMAAIETLATQRDA